MTFKIRDEVIWLTRGKDWGSRFLSTGPFTNDEAFRIYDEIFAKCDDLPYSVSGSISKNGIHEYGYFAQRFYDPERRDASGRRIIHEIVAVSKSTKLNCGTTSEVFSTSVKEYYDGIFDCDSERVVPIGDETCVNFDDKCEYVNTIDIALNDVVANQKTVSLNRHGLFLLLAVALIVGGIMLASYNGLTHGKTAVPAEAQHADPLVSTQIVNVVAQKLMTCDFLLNKAFKQNAKVYLCLFSASWCPPCRREMPRIAKVYAETLQQDPDVELVHFSCDKDESKAVNWATELKVKFPVVKPNGGNPLDLHTRGIPHLFVVKRDGSIIEEGHPMKLFNEETLKRIKQ